MPFNFFRNRRRRRWLAEPFPTEWAGWLEDGVWHYRYLTDALRDRLHDVVTVLVHEKEWTGGRDYEVTPRMRVVIAGQAALLTAGFSEPYYFDRLNTVIVNPGPYQPRSSKLAERLGGDDDPFDGDDREGESWQGGPVKLSWSVVEAEGHDPDFTSNLVMHEFAHHLDGVDGDTTGLPPINDPRFEEHFRRVTEQEFRRLQRRAHRGQPTLLDDYGASHQAEFFAVSTECFFNSPHDLAIEHPELHGVLCRLYGQDPREWLPVDP
ncbi:MAG: zinc-dependent peptidase [Planctomycetota bacterium]